MCGVVLPDMVEMGEFGAEPSEIVPDAGEDGSISSGDFSGKAAVRLARPIFCSRVNGPINARFGRTSWRLIGSK